MSDASSKPRKLRQVEADSYGGILAVILTFLSYKFPEWFISSLAPYLVPMLPASTNLRAFVLYGLFEAMAVGAIYFFVRLFNLHLRDIGAGKFKPVFIWQALVGYCAYLALALIVFDLAQPFIKIQQQTQNVGFAHPGGGEVLLAFVALVMVVPFAEELLFRGFLFKGIRRDFSFPVTAVTVSALFAVAHGQLDVGLDVFALSLVLCYLREKTGSIWPGVLLHALKNGVAFFSLFIYNVH